MKSFLYILLLIIVCQSITSCRGFLYPSEMLRISSDDNVSPNSELLVCNEHLLNVGDELDLKIYSNGGEKLLEPLTVTANTKQIESTSYIIESDGTLELPKIGRIKLQGLSLVAADSLLTQLYSSVVVEPFVQINILNKRAFVFPGGGETKAVSIPLKNQRTNLIEAIALAGGINAGKSRNVKIIRYNGNTPKIYKLDLSNFSDVQYTSIILQANDVVYVEPRNRMARKVLEEISPYLTLLSTIAVIYNISKSF